MKDADGFASVYSGSKYISYGKNVTEITFDLLKGETKMFKIGGEN